MFERGALLAERFRVVDVSGAGAGLVLADDLAGGRVLLLVRRMALSAQEVTRRVEQIARFGLGCPGLARPVAASAADGFALVAFRMPVEASVAPERGPWNAERVLALATRVARAVMPLHEQGIAHGSLRAELVFEQNAEVVLGFAVAALTRGADGSPPPEPATDLRDLRTLAAELLAGRRAPPELIAPTPRSLGASVSDALESVWATESGVAEFLRGFAAALLAPQAPPPAAPSQPVGAPSEPVAAVPRELLQPSEVIPPPGARELAPAAPPLAQPSAQAAAPRELPHPLQTPPQLTPSMPKTSLGFGVALALGLGLLMMIGGAAGAFAYVLHKGHAAPSASVASAVAPSPVTTPPAVPAPAPEPPASSDAEEEPAAPSPHVAVPPVFVASGGPSTFPEEAHAVLPLRSTDPIWGARTAAVTVMLFGDLQCPHTRRSIRTLAKLKAALGDELRLVFRHRPLSEHEYALDAARIAAGVQQRHGSPAFYRLLLEIAKDDAAVSEESLMAALASAGIAEPLDKLEALGTAAVAADLTLAAQFAINATPYSFVNGARVEGDLTQRELEHVLLAERRAADWSLAAGTSAAELYAARASINLIGVGSAAGDRACVPLGASPARGASNALVTIVEFADFECPFCKRVESSLSTLLERYPGKVRLVWKNFPLPQHAQAKLLGAFAAEALNAGGEKGFWSVHDGLLRYKSELDESALIALGGRAGLDGAELLAAASSAGHDASVRADLALGERLGVNGTPTFFVNGRRLSGALPLADLDRLLAEELRTAEHFVASGTAPGKVYERLCGSGAR